jgi:ribA/ribD-fused uncharacterized protein
MKVDNTIYQFVGRDRFLSNFWPCDINYQGLVFPSVEHAFQGCKAGTRGAKVRFSKMRSPVEAKREGRKVILRKDWERRKEKIMYCLLRKKFSIPELAKRLVATGDAVLIEGNWWKDTYWGVCDGVGENRLGKLLMRVRKEIGGV